MTSPRTTRSLAGWAMVAVQALLFLGIGFWPAMWSPKVDAMLWPSLTLVMIGALGVVASAMQLGQALTPLPEPNGAGMRARGLYRWVRHPMYTALIVICAGVAWGRGVVVAWALVAALVVFFDIKTRVEEHHLVTAYDGYAAYAARTGKFLPGVARKRHKRPRL